MTSPRGAVSTYAYYDTGEKDLSGQTSADRHPTRSKASTPVAIALDDHQAEFADEHPRERMTDDALAPAGRCRRVPPRAVRLYRSATRHTDAPT